MAAEPFVEQFDHFAVPVDDLVAAVDFYSSVFAAPIAFNRFGPMRLGLNVALRKISLRPFTFFKIAGKRIGPSLQNDLRLVSTSLPAAAPGSWQAGRPRPAEHRAGQRIRDNEREEPKMHLRDRLIVAVAALSTCLAWGAANAAKEEFSPAVKALIEAANKEGRLTLSWGNVLGGVNGVSQVVQSINQKFGTNISVVFTPGPSGPQMAGRLAQEQAARRPASTDMFPTSMNAKNAHLFHAIDWRQYLPALPAEAMHFGMRGVAFLTQLPGITYNTKRISPEMAPKSLKDLLDPKWKGRIAARISTTSFGFLSLPEFLGPKGSVDFFRKLGKQSGGMIRCGNWERIASGEYELFFPDCGDYEVREVMRHHPEAHLGQVIPSDGALITFWNAGIPLNTAHLNAAKLFVYFLLTPEGQKYVWDVQGSDSMFMPGSRIAPVVKDYKAKGVKFFVERDTLDVKMVEAEGAMLKALQESAR